MINIPKEVDISAHVEHIIKLDDYQIAVKVANPLVYVDPSHPFPPQLSGFHDGVGAQGDNFIFVHAIPQYYHNILELFPRLLLLKDTGQHFTVVFIVDNLSPHGISYNMFRNSCRSFRNIAHVLDFVLYTGIDFICVDEKTASSMRSKSAILFFDKRKWMSVNRKSENDSTIFYQNKDYYNYKFLQPCNPDDYQWAIDRMRILFPTNSIKKDRKIFISRSGTTERKFQHEKELEELMQDIGYEVVCMENMHLLDQVSLIHQSSKIVCEYGSGLVNTIFCSSQNRVLSVNHTKGYYVPYDVFLKYINVPYAQIDVSKETPISLIKEHVLSWETS